MNILIIGNGIAGSTAAREIRRRSDHDITMVSSESVYPFSRTALMYIYMGHLPFENTKLEADDYWEKQRIRLVKGEVQSVDFAHKRVHLVNRESLSYDKLILATGSVPQTFDWNGLDLDGVQGLYHLDDLTRLETASQRGITRAVIVGGGLIGIELAEMLHSRTIDVTMLVRENSFSNTVLPPEESEMVNAEIRRHHIDLRLETELKEITGENGRVSGVVLTTGEHITCNFVGITAGVRPNVDLLRSTGLAVRQGILIDAFGQITIEDVYAIGDCAELTVATPGRKTIEAVWYTARNMGETVARNICGQSTPYEQGVWFNSAKFFTIEYQVYGSVPVSFGSGVTSLFWQHQDQKKSIRLVYDANGKILGFNLMGIRYRQEVCTKWIEAKTHIEVVLEQLELANFDAEFSECHENELRKIYHQITGKNIHKKAERSLSSVVKFLTSWS
ncbi:MAG: NAD(P)/FAD-dependent oxidoreductase [Saprospiraceae bacterium]|nr:NAD(P)/FAD-dependent oxidoreductase [Saprospiraceae bacterium]